LFSNLNPINNPIVMMEEYHNEAGSIFKRISKLTNKYKAPENASKPFKRLYRKLEEFENNLNKHVHLENNILFPKAKKLELKILEY
jgi:regulator of cell morphogenesis and NO signaling